MESNLYILNWHSWASHCVDRWFSRMRPYHCTPAELTILITWDVGVSRDKTQGPSTSNSQKFITHWPNMGNADGKHTWVSCGSHMGPLRGKTHGYHVENCCILQRAPLGAAHLWPHNGNHTLAQHGKYRWQTHMGFMWVPCESFERENTWVPRGKLLHTPVCPISGSPRVAHERHTRGLFMGPVEFCYLGNTTHPSPPLIFSDYY